MNITQEEFNKSWRKMHPGMDIESELSYYWDVYQKLWNTCNTGKHDAMVRECISKLLLYIEDMGHLKFGEAFMKDYRIAGDFIMGVINEMNLTQGQSCDVQIDVYLGIKNAPESGMKAYIRDAFLGDDFNKLCNAMRWLMVRNQPLSTILPNRSTCKSHLRDELDFIDAGALEKDCLADLWLAFNWHDKNDMSIAEHVKRCFEDDPSAEYWDFYMNFDIEATDVDVFDVKRVKKDGRVFLINPEEHYNFYFEVDNVAHPIPEDYKHKCVLGMIVSWHMRCCICSPYWWISEKNAYSYSALDFVFDLKQVLGIEEQNETIELSSGETIRKYTDVACKGSFTWIGQNIPELLADSGVEIKEKAIRETLEKISNDLLGGIKLGDIACNDTPSDGEDFAEHEDISEMEAYQMHLLEVLKTGKYSIMPYIDDGDLEIVGEIAPGFNRVRVRWNMSESLWNRPEINLRLNVEEEVLEYEAVSDSWIFPTSGDEPIDELYQWLEDNIDTDYSDDRKAIKEILTFEEESTDFMPLFEYYKIDGKLYYYFGEEEDIIWTDENRQQTSMMMSKAEHIEFEEALRMVLDGDYDLLPARLKDDNQINTQNQNNNE